MKRRDYLNTQASMSLEINMFVTIQEIALIKRLMRINIVVNSAMT